MDFIEFVERGTSFEIQGDLRRGPLLLLVRPAQGDPETSDHRDLAAVGRAVDRWLAAHPAASPDEGFQGLVFEKWCHETNEVDTVAYATRGELLEWFDDGSMPTLEQAIDLAETCGDIVISVKDSQGRPLADRREQARERVTALLTPPVGF